MLNRASYLVNDKWNVMRNDYDKFEKQLLDLSDNYNLNLNLNKK